MKTILLAGAVVFGLQTAWAFSLGGPIANGGDAWQVTTIGYGLPGDLNAPKNLGEEYRRNTPTMYYAYDETFLDYFGSNGVVAVDGAFTLLNSLTNVSSYSTDLSEFPLDSRHINYQAQALGILDLKSDTLGLMAEQLGLADPVRYAWTLHDRYLPPGGACPPDEEYTVVQRNFDYFSTPLNQLQYSPYVNDTLYSYLIEEICTGPDPLAVAVPFSVDPLADIYSPVASYISGGLIMGDYYTGLTRDDVAGLRYLLEASNINWESAPTNSLLVTGLTNLNSTLPFPAAITTNGVIIQNYPGVYGTADLGALLSSSLTNDPVTLQGLFPGVVVASTATNVVLTMVTNYTAYYTNFYAEPYGTPPQLVVVTNTQPALKVIYQDTFANVITNQYRPNTYARLQTVTVAPPIGAPYGSPLATNVMSVPIILSNVPSGDFYILPTNSACGVDILYAALTNVVVTTNVIFSTAGSTNATTITTTNVTTATNLASYFYSQSLVTYSTNVVFVVHPVTCSQNSVAPELTEGIENIKFVFSSFDSLVGQFFQPITNFYTVVTVTNSQAVTQQFERIITTPDFLLDAFDGASGPSAPPGAEFGARSLTFDTANVLPLLAGPGTITTPTFISYDKVGPVYFNTPASTMDGTPYFTETPGGDLNDLFYATYFVWGSFDGTTNAPIVYPNGTSIDTLENEILIQVSPATVPNGFSDGSAYPAITFTATGGSFTPPYTWSATGLPTGLSVSPGGTLSGATMQSGAFVFTLTLTDSLARSVQWNYPLTIQ